MVTDNDDVLWTKAFSLRFILQVSFIKHINAFRKEDFHSFFYPSISHAEKLLIPTIVAHSRRDISP